MCWSSLNACTAYGNTFLEDLILCVTQVLVLYFNAFIVL